jgi:hypothetical protein
MKSIGAVVAILTAASAIQASAQDRPTVSGLLAQGYQVIHSEMGTPFLQFLLKKDNTIVWCTVQSQSGETSSCRTIK